MFQPWLHLLALGPACLNLVRDSAPDTVYLNSDRTYHPDLVNQFCYSEVVCTALASLSYKLLADSGFYIGLPWLRCQVTVNLDTAPLP